MVVFLSIYFYFVLLNVFFLLSLFFFFLMIRRPPRSTLFPYRRSSDLLHEQAFTQCLDFVGGPASPRGNRDLHEPCDVGAAEGHIEAREQRPGKLGGAYFELPQPFAIPGVGGVARDQRAVEVEEGADLGALRPPLD